VNCAPGLNRYTSVPVFSPISADDNIMSFTRAQATLVDNREMMAPGKPCQVLNVDVSCTSFPF
jgi:hypothetical protein